MSNDEESNLEEEFLNTVRRGDLELVRQLVQRRKVDGNANFVSDCPMALYSACALNDGGKMVQFLVENGADVNSKLVGRLSCLHNAILHSRLETVQTLIHYGADLNVCSQCYSPVEYACRHGNLDMLQLLVSHGGKFDVSNAIFLLVYSGVSSDDAERLAMFKLLVQNAKGYEYKKDESGITILHLACFCDDEVIVRFLIARDQRLILAQTKNGDNPVCLTQDIEVAKALLENPFNEMTGRFERNPSFIRQMLLQRNIHGKTTLEELLEKKGYEETIEYIRTYFSPLAVGDGGTANPDLNPFQQRLAAEIRDDLGKVLVDDLARQVMRFLSPVDVMERSM